LFFVESGWPLFLLDGLEGAYGSQDVAGLGFFTARNRCEWRWVFGRGDVRAGSIALAGCNCDWRRCLLWWWFLLGGSGVGRNGVKQRRLSP
jgi:hypothetical protein